MNIGQPASATPENDDNSRGPSGGNQTILLGLLNAIATNGERSQRGLSSDLGVALGLANTYLARCIKKGFVKASQVPPNRYAYYLTPKGFMEKSRLTREFLVQSFSLFRQARSEFAELLTICEERAWKRIVVWGCGDIAEVVVLCLLDRQLSLAGFVDPAQRVPTLAGRPVFADLKSAGGIDAVLLADLDDSQGAYDHLAQRLPAERILVPRFLSVMRELPRGETP